MLPSLARRRTTQSPLDRFLDLHNDMDRLFNGIPRNIDTQLAGYMPAEILEQDNEVQLRIEVPGLDPEQIELTVENNVLTVSGERKWEYEQSEPKGEFHLFERRYGRFERSFALPQRVVSDRIEATCEHGVLSVVLPKVEEARPQRIAVKPGGSRQVSTG